MRSKNRILSQNRYLKKFFSLKTKLFSNQNIFTNHKQFNTQFIACVNSFKIKAHFLLIQNK